MGENDGGTQTSLRSDVDMQAGESFCRSVRPCSMSDRTAAVCYAEKQSGETNITRPGDVGAPGELDVHSEKRNTGYVVFCQRRSCQINLAMGRRRVEVQRRPDGDKFPIVVWTMNFCRTYNRYRRESSECSICLDNSVA